MRVPNASRPNSPLPPAITSDCGTLPSAGKGNFSPRQVIVLAVKSMSISSPGMIVFSLRAISSANCSRRRSPTPGLQRTEIRC